MNPWSPSLLRILQFICSFVKTQYIDGRPFIPISKFYLDTFIVVYFNWICDYLIEFFYWKYFYVTVFSGSVRISIKVMQNLKKQGFTN